MVEIGRGLSDIPRAPTPHVQRATGWVGWVLFAGTMLVLLGGFHVIWGLAALIDDDFFVVGSDGLPLNIDYAVFGWTHLVGGVLLLAIGVGLFVAQPWARIAGIVVVMIFTLVDFVGLSSFPVWSMIMIAVQVLVIYALAVHAAEVSELGEPL